MTLGDGQMGPDQQGNPSGHRSEPIGRACPGGRRPIRAAPGATFVTRADLQTTWDQLEEIGRLTGHVLTQCPECKAKAMTSILNTSGTSRWVKSGGGWPRCRQCVGRPRVVPIGDIDRVLRVQPGHNPKPRVLAAYRKREEAR